MDYKFDYLRFSIIPQFEIHNRLSFISFIIRAVLGMADKIFDFETAKCGGFYDFKFYYHNIYIKAPPEDKPGEGFQVEMTGEGYDYYIQYRLSHDPQFSQKKFFANLITLSENNSYKVNFTRLDIAVDDKSRTDKGLLDFATIRESVLDGAILTRFRHRTIVTNGDVMTSPDKNTPYIIYEKGSSNVKAKGSTLYLGDRRGSHCRFYDKLAEMQAHKKEYDPNLKHWLRFEAQLCHDNAAFVITRFVSMDSEAFSKFLSQYLLNLVRFVDNSREKLASNYYRCPVVGWWSKFLGTVEKSRLVHVKPKANRYAKSVKWIKKSVAASAGAVIKSVGFQNFCGILKEGMEEHYRSHHDMIVDDFLHYGNYEFDKLSGVDVYKVYFTDDQQFREFLIEMRKLREETVLKAMELEKTEQNKVIGWS